jgi:hypothetical protein
MPQQEGLTVSTRIHLTPHLKPSSEHTYMRTSCTEGGVRPLDEGSAHGLRRDGAYTGPVIPLGSRHPPLPMIAVASISTRRSGMISRGDTTVVLAGTPSGKVSARALLNSL